MGQKYLYCTVLPDVCKRRAPAAACGDALLGGGACRRHPAQRWCGCLPTGFRASSPGAGLGSAGLPAPPLPPGPQQPLAPCDTRLR
eukprot:scaffold6890_cov48-Phaeocystis_antarctica.AAC.1